MNIDQLLQATPARLSILNRPSAAPAGATAAAAAPPGSYAVAAPPASSYAAFQHQQMQTRSFQSNVMPQPMSYHQPPYTQGNYYPQTAAYPGASYDLAEPQIAQPPRPMTQAQQQPSVRPQHSYYPQPPPLRIPQPAAPAVNYSLLSPGTQSIAQQWNIPAASAGVPTGAMQHPHHSAANSFYTSAASSIHPTQPHASHVTRALDMDESLDLSIDTPSPAAMQPITNLPARQVVATAPVVPMTLEEQNAHLQQQRQRLRELTAAAGIAPSEGKTVPSAASYAFTTQPPPPSSISQTIPAILQPQAPSIYLRPEDDPDEDVSVGSDDETTKSKSRSTSRSPSFSPRSKAAKSKLGVAASPKSKDGGKIRSELSRIYELLGQNDSFYSTVNGSPPSAKKTQKSKQPEVKKANVTVEDEVSEEEEEEKEQEPEVHVHVHVHPSPPRGRPRSREPLSSTVVMPAVAAPGNALKKSVSFHEQDAPVQAQVLEEPLQATIKRPTTAPAATVGSPESSPLPQSLPLSPPISLDDLSDSVAVTLPAVSTSTAKSNEKENPKATAAVRGSVMKIASAPLRASAAENRSAIVRNLAQDTAAKKASNSNKKTTETTTPAADVASSLRTLKSRRVIAPAPFEPSASYRRPGPGGAAGSAPSAQNAESKVSEKALPSDLGVFMPTGSFHASSSNKLAHSSMKHASDKPRITGHEATVLARLASTARVPRPIQCAISLYGETITQEQLNEMTKGDEKPKKPQRSPSPPTHPPRASPLVLRGPISKRIGTYSPQKALTAGAGSNDQAIEPRSPLGARESIPEADDDEKYPAITSRPPMLAITAGSSAASSAPNSPKMISVAGIAAERNALQLMPSPTRSPSVVEVADETEADRIEAEAIERNKAGLEALFAQMSQNAGLDGFSLEHRTRDAGTTPSVPRVASFSLDKPLRPSKHVRSRSASPAVTPRLGSRTTSADFSPRSRPRSESASPMHRPLLRRAQSMQIGGSEPTSPVLYHWPSSPVLRHQRSFSVGNLRPSLSRSSSTSSISTRQQKPLGAISSGRTSRSSSLTSSPLHSARSTQSARPLPPTVSVGSPTLRRSASVNVTSSRSEWLPQPDKQTLTPRSPDGAAEARRERIRARSLSLEQYGLDRSPDRPSLSRLPSRTPSIANSRQPSVVFPTVPTPRGSGNLSSRSLAPSQAEQARSATGSLAHTRSSSLAPSPVLDPIVEPENSRPGSAAGFSPSDATSSTASPVPPPNEAVKSFLQNLLTVTGTLQQDPKTRDLANQLLLASLAPGSILRTAAASATLPSVAPPIVPPLQLPNQSPVSVSDRTSSDSATPDMSHTPAYMYRAASMRQGATVAAGGSFPVPTDNIATPNSPLNPLNLPPPMKFDDTILRPNRETPSLHPTRANQAFASMPYGSNLELFNSRGQFEAKALIEGRHVGGSSNKPGSGAGPSGNRGPSTLAARLASLKPIAARKKTSNASPRRIGKNVPSPILLPTARSLMKYRLHILARIRSELARHELLHVEQVKLLKAALEELVARRKDVEAEAREEILYQSYLSLTKRHEERRRMKAELTGENPDPDDPDAETIVQEALVRELSRLSPTNPLLMEQVEAHPAVQRLHQQRQSINLQLVWIGWTHAHARKRLRQALIEAARDGYDAFEVRANATLWRVITCRGQRDLVEQAASTFTKQEAQQFAFEPYENFLRSVASITRKDIPTFEDAQSHLEHVRRVQAVRKWKSLSSKGHSMHEQLSQFLTKRYSRALYAFWSEWRVKVLRIYKQRIQTQMAYVYAELMHEARSFRSWRMSASRDAFLLHQVAVAAEQLKLQQAYDAQLQMFHHQQQQHQQLLLMSASANNSFSLDQSLNQSVNHSRVSKAPARSGKSFMRDTVSTLEKRSRPTPAGKRKVESETPARKKPLEPMLNTSSASTFALPPQPSPPMPPAFTPPPAPALAQYYARSISPANSAVPMPYESWVHQYAHLLRSNVLSTYREQLAWIESQLSVRANAQAPIGWIIDRFVQWSLERENEERKAIERVRRERERVQNFKEYMGSAGNHNFNLLRPAEELNASTASTSAFSPAASARAASVSATTPRSIPYSYSATSSPERGPINSNRQKHSATVSFSSPASPVKDSMQSRQQRLLEAPQDSIAQVDESSQTQLYSNELVNEEMNRSIEEQHANLEIDFLRSHMPLSVPVPVVLPGDDSLLNHTTNLGAVPEGFIRDSEEDENVNSEQTAKTSVMEWLKQFDLPNPEDEEVRMLDEHGRAIIRSPLRPYMPSPAMIKKLQQSGNFGASVAAADATTNEISLHADGSVDTSRLDMSQGNEHHVHVHHFPPELNRAVAAEQETIQRQQRQIEQLEQENQQLHLQQSLIVEQTQQEIEQQQEVAQLQLKKELLAQFNAYADQREAELKQQWELEQDHELQLQEDIHRANAKKQQQQRKASPVAARAKHNQSIIDREEERQHMIACDHWAYTIYRKVFSSWMARTQLAHLERLAIQQRLQREEETQQRERQKQKDISVAATAAQSNNATASDPELSAALELSQIPSRDVRRASGGDSTVNAQQASSTLNRSGLRLRTPAEEGVLRPVYPELVDERRIQEQLSQSIHQVEHSIDSHRNHALDDGAGTAYEASAEVRTMSAALDQAMFKRFASNTDRRTQLNLETAILKVPVKSHHLTHDVEVSNATSSQPESRAVDASGKREARPEPTVPSSHILSPTDLRELLLIAAASIEPNAGTATDAPTTASVASSSSTIPPPASSTSIMKPHSAASRFEPSIVHRPSSSIASFTDLSFTPSTSFGAGGFQNKPGNMWLNSLDVSAVEHAAASNDQSLMVMPGTMTAPAVALNVTDNTTAVADSASAVAAPISSLLVDPLRPPARPLPRLSFNFAALKRKV